MTDEVQTPPNENLGTEGEQPEVTPETNPQGAAPNDDEVVTIKKSSLKKLQSDSTKNYERLRQVEYRQALAEMKEDITSYLTENKAKFPDVQVEDLLDAEAPEDFEKLAGNTQKRIDEAAQRRLGDLQKTQTPALTPQEKSAQLKKLKENPGSQSFQKMLELESQ